MSSTEWRFSIQPNRATALAAVILVWLFFAPLIAWGIFGEPGPGAAIIFTGFPLVITYYGLKSALGVSGKIDIDREGFSVMRGLTKTERFAWSEVGGFVIGKFGMSPTYDGKDVPHFLVPDGSGGWRENWLPANTGYSADKLVAAMEKLRLLALAGWPQQPTSLKDIFD
jgi:hypothetical protein